MKATVVLLLLMALTATWAHEGSPRRLLANSGLDEVVKNNDNVDEQGADQLLKDSKVEELPAGKPEDVAGKQGLPKAGDDLQGKSGDLKVDNKPVKDLPVKSLPALPDIKKEMPKDTSMDHPKGSCPDGSNPVQCFADPCQLPDAKKACAGTTCTSNYCGGCNYVCGPKHDEGGHHDYPGPQHPPVIIIKEKKHRKPVPAPIVVLVKPPSPPPVCTGPVLEHCCASYELPCYGDHKPKLPATCQFTALVKEETCGVCGVREKTFSYCLSDYPPATWTNKEDQDDVCVCPKEKPVKVVVVEAKASASAYASSGAGKK